MKMSKRKKTGKPYEIAAEAYFKEKFPESNVQRNVKIQGVRGEEQIDVLITTTVGEYEFRMGVEAKDYQKRLDKDRFASIEMKFKSAKLNKGIILCAHGVQSGVTKRIATSEFDFKVEVLTFEQLVEGAWSFDFLEAIPRLKDAKVATEPSTHLAQRVVLAIETHGHYARYFFHELKNPVWIPVLAQSGVLERCLKKDSKLNPVFVAEYLAQFANVCPKEFLRFAKAFRPPHRWIEHDLLHGALNLDSKSRSEFVKSASKWEEVALWETEDVATLVIREFEDGRTNQGLAFLSALTRLKAISREGFGATLYDLTSPMQDFWFKELTLDFLPKLVPLGTTETLPYARKRLLEAVNLKHPTLKGGFPTWIHNHVGDQGQYGPSGYLDLLLFAYRDCLCETCRINPGAAIDECREVMANSIMQAPLRCVLYAIANNFESIGMLMDEIPDAWWNDNSLEPEFETLVEKGWLRMSEIQRIRVCELILALPGRKFESAEDTVRFHKIQLVHWLALLKELPLPEIVNERVNETYQRLASETGVTGREYRGGPFSVFINSVPDEAASFGKLTAREVLCKCIEFREYSVGVHDKTPEGLSSALQEQVKARTTEFMDAPDLLEKLPYPTYQAAVLRGLAEAAIENQIVSVKSIIAVANLIVSKLADCTDDQHRLREVGHRNWTLREAVELIGNIASRRTENIDINDFWVLFDLWVLLRGLDQDHDASAWDSNHSIFTETLNSNDGQRSIALARLAVRILRIANDSKETGQSKETAKKLYDLVRAEIDSFVLMSPLARVRCPLGTHVTELWHWDRPFVEGNVDRFFPVGSPLLTMAMFEGHFHFSQRFVNVFQFLKPVYARSVNLLAREDAPSHFVEGFANDIAIFWFEGVLDNEDQLLKDFVRIANDDALRTALHWIWSQLRPNCPLGHWQKAISFWKLLLESRPDAGEALGHALHWLSKAPPEISVESVEPVIEAAMNGEKHHLPPDAFKFLEKRSASEPLVVARVLACFAKNANSYLASTAVEDLKRATQKCYLNGDESAKQLALEVERQMLLKGALRFEGTVTKLAPKEVIK